MELLLLIALVAAFAWAIKLDNDLKYERRSRAATAAKFAEALLDERQRAIDCERLLSGTAHAHHSLQMQRENYEYQEKFIVALAESFISTAQTIALADRHNNLLFAADAALGQHRDALIEIARMRR